MGEVDRVAWAGVLRPPALVQHLLARACSPMRATARAWSLGCPLAQFVRGTEKQSTFCCPKWSLEAGPERRAEQSRAERRGKGRQMEKTGQRKGQGRWSLLRPLSLPLPWSHAAPSPQPPQPPQTVVSRPDFRSSPVCASFLPSMTSSSVCTLQTPSSHLAPPDPHQL